jgi:hypothetical protein
MDFWTGLAIGATLIVIVAAMAWCTRKPNPAPSRPNVHEIIDVAARAKGLRDASKIHAAADADGIESLDENALIDWLVLVFQAALKQPRDAKGRFIKVA